jgi:hypothetical protein
MAVRNHTTTILPLLVMLAACAGAPEQRAYETANWRAAWLDRFHTDSEACQAEGGHIVQERHQPTPIRIGATPPEVGTRYWCEF